MTISIALSALTTTNALSETIYVNTECWSEEAGFRSNGDNNNLINTMIFARLERQGDSMLLKNLYGHVAGAKFVDGATQIRSADFYGQLNTKEKMNSLSPTARKYLDIKYWRYNDITNSSGTSFDGGGLWGTFVISKDMPVDTYSDEEFDAHFIFQHGDHTGGTIDLKCSRR